METQRARAVFNTATSKRKGRVTKSRRLGGLSDTARYTMIRKAIPDMGQLSTQEASKLIRLAARNPQAFARSMGERIGDVAKALGPHLETFGSKVDMEKFGRGVPAYYFARGAGEHLESFAKGADLGDFAYGLTHNPVPSIGTFSSGAGKNIEHFARGAGKKY